MSNASVRGAGRLPVQRQPSSSGLPLTPPEDAEVGPVEQPHGAGAPQERPTSEMARRPFVRPPGEQIDFARVVRRSDLSRRAVRVSWTCLLLSGACLVGYLLMPTPALLVAVVAAALVSVGAGALRTHLESAAVPRLPR